MKPQGYYVQHSCGLFPAPWPQDNSDLPRIFQLFELMGMFVAKCIQDGRRVDLPLAQPFFKLMCTSWERGVAKSIGTPTDEEDVSDRDQVTPASQNALLRSTSMENSNDQERVSSRNSITSPSGLQQDQRSELLILESGVVAPSNNEATRASHHGEAGAKGADLVLDAVEISKDGGCKDQVTLQQVEGEGTEEKLWFEDILERSDFLEVNPYHGKFLHQLQQLVQQRDTVRAKEELSEQEKESQIASLTLPALEKNIPGAHLEDLW